jgi:hypothetical protein
MAVETKKRKRGESERRKREKASPRIHARMEAMAPRTDPTISRPIEPLFHAPRRSISHQPARIRFLGGRARNTAERSRATGKKARGGVNGDGSLRLAPPGATHAGFRGAGGHSVGGRSLLSSDVGVVGSASSSRFPGAVDDDEAAGEGRASSSACGGAVVLIGGSAGRTSPAVEAIIGRRRSRGRCDALSAIEGGEERR